MPTDAWVTVAAALPQQARWERELPFWRSLAGGLSWRRVVDAGCGAGFHVSLLASLGVKVVGFDLSLGSLHDAPRGAVAVGDVGAPPLRAASADAVLCLGNAVSLLPSRSAQRGALAALALLVRPGGHLLVQGEDAGALVAASPVVRTRSLPDGRSHVRVFERRGRRVRMLAGAAPAAGEAPLAETWLVPTSADAAARLAESAGLRRVALPAAPPGSGGWWVLLQR